MGIEICQKTNDSLTNFIYNSSLPITDEYLSADKVKGMENVTIDEVASIKDLKLWEMKPCKYGFAFGAISQNLTEAATIKFNKSIERLCKYCKCKSVALLHAG
jgi:Co/Zn/Cd efflux system component